MLSDLVFDEQSGTATDRPDEGFKVVGITLLALIVLLAVGYGALVLYTGDRAPRGTTVGGVGIGGLRPGAAQARLVAALAPVAARPLTLTYQGRTFRVVPARAGITVDYGASVSSAGGEHSLDPHRIWHFFTGGTATQPVVQVNPAQLKATLAQIAARLDRAPRDGSVQFTRTGARPVPARTGLVLDRARAAAVVRSLFLHGTSASLPVTQVAPRVGNGAVGVVMRTFANPAMADPITLEVAGRRVTLGPRVYAGVVSVLPAGARLVPQVDAHALLSLLRGRLPGVGPRARSARVSWTGGVPHVVPGAIGLHVDVPELGRDFTAYLTRPPGERVMPVHASVTVPGLTTAQAQGIVGGPVGSASYTLGSGSGAGLAADAARVDHLLLTPGQTVPIPAMAGSAGAAVTTAVYDAALRAGLQIPSRSAHRVYDSRFPPGLDAVGLSLRAPGPFSAMLNATTTRDTVTVTVWSTATGRVALHLSPRYDVIPPKIVQDSGPGCVASTGVPGFRIDLVRTLHPRHGGSPTHSVTVTRYAMQHGTTCG